MAQKRDSYSLTEIFISLIPFFVAPVIWAYFGRFASATYGFWNQSVELFCGLEALAIIYITYKRIKDGFELESTLIRFGLFLAILLYISEIAAPSWDYERYANAASAVCSGKNPYAVEPNYLYPPLLAQLLCGCGLFLEKLGISSFASHHAISYVYRVVQFYLFVYIHYELVCLYSLYESSEKRRELIVALALLLNVPLFRTIKHMQLNLVILALMLLAIRMASLKKHLAQMVAGLAVAFGTLLKLYPAILLFPLMVLKRFRVVAWMAAYCVILTALFFVASPEAWLGYFKNPVPSAETFSHFRNAGVAGFLAVHIKAFGFEPIYKLLKLIGLVFALLVIMPVFYSIIRGVATTKSVALENNSRSVWGFYAITIAVGLLLSPLIWEHHYVFAMPLAIWAIGEFGITGRVLVPLALIFPIPVFDLAFLSVHRLVGLIWLILLCYKRIRAQD